MLPVEWHKLCDDAYYWHGCDPELQMLVADRSDARHAVYEYEGLHCHAAALEAGYASGNRQPSLQALQCWAVACKNTS